MSGYLAKTGSNASFAAGTTWPGARAPLRKLDDDRDRDLLGVDGVCMACELALQMTLLPVLHRWCHLLLRSYRRDSPGTPYD